MLRIDLNCDMGEGFATDALLMPFISSANIACGYHAGDADTMKRTVELCLQHNVRIGAHPSYADRENFGRIDLMYTRLKPDDLQQLLHEQLHALQKVCGEAGAKLHHVKPHGALYNRAAKDELVSTFICRAIQEFDSRLILYGLSGSIMETAAKQCRLAFRNEVFADRTYQDDGTLRPRSFKDALITDTSACVRQVLQMVREGTVITVEQNTIPMKAETICIHGDGAHAVEFARVIHETLHANGILVK